MIKIIRYSKETEINDNAKVKVTEMGNVVELQYMARRNDRQTVHRIDETTYMVVSTGEIKEFQKDSENRTENINGLRKTFRKLRGVINSNFFGEPNELHIILTYKENMQDTERLYKDFKKFMMRLKYRYKKELVYISVVEPQGRGAWHCHLLIKAPTSKSLYMASGDVLELWGHGHIKVKSLNRNDNIGAYLSAYLGDIELEPDQEPEAGQEVLIKKVDGESKRFIKGGRLHLYPSGMNIFRTSKNIKRPREYLTSYEKAKSANGLGEPVYTQKIEVDNEDFKNVIQYEQYNIKRT